MTMATVASTRCISIPSGSLRLFADVCIPERAAGIVLFAHAGGSSRLRPGDRYVAAGLHAGGLATILLDLLTPEEERIGQVSRQLRLDIPLLAKRLVAATDWVEKQPHTPKLRIGYFGASTGAAAALVAAAERPETVAAVVSRGGRPDLALQRLAQVRAPTLLIVGGLDTAVIEPNRRALASIEAKKQLVIVPGATHLFEEPGTLDRVTELARDWFVANFAEVQQR